MHNIKLSATILTGGASNIITSKFCFTICKNVSKPSVSKSSAGFGGTIPDGIKNKFFTSVVVIDFIKISACNSISSSIPITPCKKSENPLVLNLPNILCCLPFLKSASTNNTFLSLCAYAAARFADTQLFPSPGAALVKSIT